MNRSVYSLVCFGLLLSACGTQAPVSVIDGYGKRKITYPSDVQQGVSSEEVAFNLQSEAILTAQEEEKYYVHGGDKLDQIAKHFGVSEMAILARNNIASEGDMPIGQFIVIPSPNWVSANVPENLGYQAPVATNVSTDSQTYRLYNRENQLPHAPELTDAVSVKSEYKSSESDVSEGFQKPERTIELMRSHELQPGENVYRLSLKYNVSQFDILAANGIRNPEDLKPGMVLKIPYAGEKVEGAGDYKYLARNEASVAGGSLVAVKPNVVTKPKVESISAPVKMKTNDSFGKAEAAVDLSDSYYSDLAKRYGSKHTSAKGLIWPADGKILKSFGVKDLGVTYNGIKIGLPNNAPIYAAESGKVIYADDGLELYGNLILIQHANGLVTAYGHNSKNLVQANQKVTKGDLIAFAGSTGNVDKPQLHFEVRKNAQPVNPMKYLPKR